MLNFEYAETVMVETGSLKLYQNRPGPVQGKCCLKNVKNFGLTLFWYSPTNRKLASIADINYKNQVSCVLIFSDIVNVSELL
jgi:hypothetical protein